MADLSITAANVKQGANASRGTGTAGATITAGQAVRRNAAGLVVLAQADEAATADADGIALNGAANGQPVAYHTGGGINMGATLVVGMVYAVSAAAAGGIAPITDLTAGDFVTVLGVATAADNLQCSIINSGAEKPA